MLPLPEACALPVPTWPCGKVSTAQAALWKRLWRLPVAAYWHDQGIEPDVVALFVQLRLERPEHASVTRLATELGLTPAAMLRMRLVVERPEPEESAGPNPYEHLRAVGL